MSTILHSPGYSFDVAHLFPAFPIDPGPAGEIILRVPEGITPCSLRRSAIGTQLIHQDVTRFDTEPWATESIAPGAYHLRLPVLDSNHKSFEEQRTLLHDGEEVAPLVLIELALLCLKKACLPDVLQRGWVHCRETYAGGRVVLCWYSGRLYVSDRLNNKGSLDVWIAGVRKAS